MRCMIAGGTPGLPASLMYIIILYNYLVDYHITRVLLKKIIIWTFLLTGCKKRIESYPYELK